MNLTKKQGGIIAGIIIIFLGVLIALSTRQENTEEIKIDPITGQVIISKEKLYEVREKELREQIEREYDESVKNFNEQLIGFPQ